MSILQFSDEKYAKTFDDDEEIRLGSFSTNNSGWLGNIRTNIYINEVFNLVGNETLQMKVYSDPNLNTVWATSKEFKLSEIAIDSSDLSKTGFLGYVRFDFNQEHINSQYTYYPTVQISNYSRVGDFFVSMLYDFPDPVYDNGEANFFDHPIAMQIFTLRNRT